MSLFLRTLTERAELAVEAPPSLPELAHALKQLISVLGLAQLSSVLVAASEALPDGIVAVAERLAYGHGQLIAVHAADVTARAIVIATGGHAVSRAHASVFVEAAAAGPLRADPRPELTARLRALTGAHDAATDLRGVCAGLALLSARLGVNVEITPCGVVGDIRARLQTVSTRPAPPPNATEDSDAS